MRETRAKGGGRGSCRRPTHATERFVREMGSRWQAGGGDVAGQEPRPLSREEDGGGSGKAPARRWQGGGRVWATAQGKHRGSSQAPPHPMRGVPGGRGYGAGWDGDTRRGGGWHPTKTRQAGRPHVHRQ